MSSSDPSYQQLGLDAINTCFISSSMMCSEAPFFHPSIVPHDASFGSGDAAGGGGADVAAHYMANDAMEMDEDAYAFAGAESYRTVHSMSMLPAAGPLDFFPYGPADVTIAQPSKMAKLITGEPHCSWLYDGPSAVSIHEPYYLTPFSGAGFPDPLAAATSGLSLRLGAQSSSVTMASLQDQSSEVSCSGLTHVNSEVFGYQQQPQTVKAHAGDGMPFQQLPLDGGAGAGVGELRRHVYPQMYAQVLSRSRYAHIAEELLNGFVVCLLNDVADKITDASVSGGIGSEASVFLPTSRSPSSVSSNQLMLPSDEQRQDDVGWVEAQKLRSDLLRLLQLMDQRCNRCFDDIQTTASRFSSMVAHSGAIIAAPRFAHRAVWATYQRLRKRITSMMVLVAQREQPSPSSLADKERRWESSFIQKHWTLQQLRRGDQQSWRPQRGLPEKSVAVLKAWMFENFLRPYPKDNEKDMLAARSGLSRSQVSNWFINARVRLWKPMIEEMYEELKRSSGGREVEHLSSKDVVC